METFPYRDIVLGDLNAYWLSAGGISSIRKDLSVADPTPAGLAVGTEHIAGFDDAAIFGGNVFTIARLNPAFDNLVDFVNSKTDMTDMVVNGTFVYWPSSADSKIYKADITAAVPVVPVPVEIGKGSDSMAVLGAIAASPALKDIYWLYRNDATNTGGIMAYGDAAATEFQVLPTPKPIALAVDTDAVYWLTSNGVAHGRLKAQNMPIFDSAPLGMVSGSANFDVGKIAVGGNYAYWIGATSHTCNNPPKGCGCGDSCGAIMAARKGDLADPKPFAKGLWDDMKGLAVDNQYVYWSVRLDAKTDAILRKAVLP
jgi:hypothetical protein